MTTLRKAREDGLEYFIKEHESDEDGDLDKLDAALKRPFSGKSSAAQEASKPDTSGDCT